MNMRVWICSKQPKFMRHVHQVIQTRYPATRVRYLEGTPTRMVDDIGWGLMPPHIIIIDERLQGWDPDEGVKLFRKVAKQRVMPVIVHLDTDLKRQRRNYGKYRVEVHEQDEFRYIEWEVIEIRYITWDGLLRDCIGEAEEKLRQQERDAPAYPEPSEN